MKGWWTILGMLVCFTVNAQSKKYKAHIENYKCDSNTYFSEYSCSEFLNSDLADEELDLLNVDSDLLNATVFFTINKYRKKKRRAQLVHSPELDKCASSYASYYSSSSFKRTDGNKRKSGKAAKYAAKKFGFKGAFVEVVFSKKAMLDKKKLGVYYHDGKATREKGDDLGLYYGKRPSRNDTTEKEPIEPYTYRTFAEDLVEQWFKGSNSRISKSKALTIASCYVVLDKRTLFNSKMPSAKAIFILGGNRTELLPNEPIKKNKELVVTNQ